MNINQYLAVLQERYARGIATEHSYRGDLQQLLETLLPKYHIKNEPRRSKVGALDYIITQDTIARGYIKVKDVDKSPVTYPAAGTNTIDRKLTKTSLGWEPHTISNQNASSSAVENQALGKVWINDTQYFDNVPLAAWKFYIGGYQPAQKWLKDRKDRELTIEDVQHYRKIIKARIATERLMGEVDNIAEF